jgi:hypothetical protein
LSVDNLLTPGFPESGASPHGTRLLRRAIGINLVIAWRIMFMTLLGRENPALPAEVLFSDIELRVSCAYAKKKTEATYIVG